MLEGVTIAVFGLGEAGSEISTDLAAAGATVRGYDPADVDDVPGVQRSIEPGAAVAGAQLVMGITASTDAANALSQALEAIPSGAVYADLSSSSPGQERELAARAGGRGLQFADVALMSTVPGKGLRTPVLVSGPGAHKYADLLAPGGGSVEVVGPDAGQAAARKLLRSIVLKGLAGVVIESMRAANSAGLGEENWGNLVDQMTEMDEAFLRRIVDGTGQHSLRRQHEMEATVEMLHELGIDPVMTEATVESLSRMSVDGVPELPSEG
jgi:3-hydroxyisobutyrate dehydrogenase-like beta-hydroxyacid dehydrogenase